MDPCLMQEIDGEVMLVTCAILCHNYGRYLRKAIDSCLKQSADNLAVEVLVLDDGSTDETPDVCRSYGNAIRWSPTNRRGFGATLGRALTEASGKYVCLLDADDFFAESMLRTIEPFIREGLLYIEHHKGLVDESGKSLDATKSFGGSTSTLCVDRAAAQELLPVHNEIFFHPLKDAGRGVVLDKVLSYYRMHTSSMTNVKPATEWYLWHAEGNFLLAERLTRMLNCSWANNQQLRRIGEKYRAEAAQDRVESALHRGARTDALLHCIPMFWHAFQSSNGLRIWNFRVLARAILGRPIRRLI